jgi:hypothetical protein
MCNIKDQIIKIWDNKGHNAPDTIAEIKGLNHSGFDESYDNSLCVFYFVGVVVVIGDCNLTIIDSK